MGIAVEGQFPWSSVIHSLRLARCKNRIPCPPLCVLILILVTCGWRCLRSANILLSRLMVSELGRVSVAGQSTEQCLPLCKIWRPCRCRQTTSITTMVIKSMASVRIDPCSVNTHILIATHAVRRTHTQVQWNINAERPLLRIHEHEANWVYSGVCEA